MSIIKVFKICRAKVKFLYAITYFSAYSVVLEVEGLLITRGGIKPKYKLLFP